MSSSLPRFGWLVKRTVASRCSLGPMRSIRPSTLKWLLCLCVFLCACGADAGGTKDLAIRVIDVSGAGPVLADGAGYPLYVYLPDNQGRSRCTLACATEWPPFVLSRGIRTPLLGHHVDPALLGTTRRSDGALQVTYNHWPLYTYLADTPGQANGQGAAMGAWYLISTNGAVDRRPVTGDTSS